MLATLWLVGLSLPMLWAQKLISCPYKNVCQYALLSGNDVILQCNYPKALWYFSSSLEDKLSLVNSMPDVKVLSGSDLQLSNPKPSQTGLYRCLDDHKARVVEYEIDFQDIALLHITHKDLGQKPMGNESMNLGGKVLVFTRWDPWQHCNRCQKPGERKRLGYCYVEEPLEKPMPCWLYMREEKVTDNRLRPELQIQACQVPCDTATETKQPYFVFDLYQLDKPNNHAPLKCPLASIYRLVANAQPSSQSTMFTILWILLSFALPVLGPHIPVSCPKAKECVLALLSSNDVVLECSVSGAHWLISGPSEDGKPINPSSVPNIRKRPDGGIHIQNPLPSNTGLYQCRDENGNQVTSYKIDFQDINRLHATHINLEQKPLMNQTLNLGHREVVYTQWGPWQRCSKCDSLGERKRLGYCYIKEPLEEPVPCGLYLGGVDVFYARVRPEMQVETCYENCGGNLMGGHYIIFDNFRFTEESESALLTCPFATIYRPVHWEVNDNPLTWQDQLSGQEINTVMDLHSGGQHLKVFQPATYRCFVAQELIAQFNPTPSACQLEAEGQAKAQGPWRSRIQPGKADSVLRGLKLLLLIVSVLAVGGFLCKVVFRPACGEKRNQVLLVK